MNQDKLKLAIQMLLEGVEGDRLRPELHETPARVCKALTEMLDGYSIDIESLFKTFDGEGTDQLVIAKNIPFVSLCEHHCLPVRGKANVGYLPRNKVLGASKLPRIVLAYAHRLQLQERIAKQVADSIMEHLNPLGVAVVISATHDCMSCRGIKSSGTELVNSVMLGKFREDSTLRAEFLNLITL